MITEKSSNQPCGRNSGYDSGPFLKCFGRIIAKSKRGGGGS